MYVFLGHSQDYRHVSIYLHFDLSISQVSKLG